MKLVGDEFPIPAWNRSWFGRDGYSLKCLPAQQMTDFGQSDLFSIGQMQCVAEFPGRSSSDTGQQASSVHSDPAHFRPKWVDIVGGIERMRKGDLRKKTMRAMTVQFARVFWATG
jgi:hypothetical protein